MGKWKTNQFITILVHCEWFLKYNFSVEARLTWRGNQMPCLLHHINSLVSGKFELNFRHVIFKQILVIDGWGISCEIVLIWMSLDFTDNHLTLVQVMAWCRQAPSHYLSQCWPRSLSPYGVTRPHNYWMEIFLRKYMTIFAFLSFLDTDMA